MTIQLRSLTIAAPDGRPLLARIDHEFPVGVTALAGANGVGKSTLLRAIATVYPIAGGQILLGGLDSRQQLTRYLERLMFLPQTFPAYPELTGREFLEYTLRLRGAAGKDAREVSSAWLQQVNLDTVSDERTGSYSQGMLQRLGVAYAMQVDAEAYVLDEPFSGVDLESRERMMEVLFLAGRAKVVLVTTHEVEAMARMGARVVHIKDSKLLQ